MDLAPSPLLLLLSLLLMTKQQVGALRLINVNVPPFVRRGENARLECNYDLDRDKLYSVTWYKDNEHIFSYVRQHNARKHAFAVEGVHIDSYKSNSQTLHLQSVSLNSTGYYACEVNTDSRPFKYVKGEAYMEVIEPPKDDPKITGEEKIYATGDILALNCSSGFSYPEAQLQWFINGFPVDDPESEVLHFSSRGLRSTRLSLRIKLDPSHLAKERIEVKCVSTVQTSHVLKKPFIDTRITRIYVQGAGSLSTPSTLLLLLALLLLTFFQKN